MTPAEYRLFLATLERVCWEPHGLRQWIRDVTADLRDATAIIHEATERLRSAAEAQRDTAPAARPLAPPRAILSVDTLLRHRRLDA